MEIIRGLTCKEAFDFAKSWLVRSTCWRCYFGNQDKNGPNGRQAIATDNFNSVLLMVSYPKINTKCLWDWDFRLSTINEKCALTRTNFNTLTCLLPYFCSDTFQIMSIEVKNRMSYFGVQESRIPLENQWLE